MSGDWTEGLDGWDDFVAHTRRVTVEGLAASAFVMSLVPRGEPDIKFAVELGLSIMLDKPILAVVLSGSAVPEKLRRVADEVVVADVDTEEGVALVAAAVNRMAERV